MPINIPLLVISALETMMYGQALKGLEQYKANSNARQREKSDMVTKPTETDKGCQKS